MTQEDKELLLKYLCMELPYGVKVLHEGWNYEWDDSLSTIERIVGIDENFIYTKVIDTSNGEEYREDKHPIDTFDDKPYLRQMSNMTQEEATEYANCGNIIVISHQNYFLIPNPKSINWLLEHHFDFMELIPKGLAIEVTESNNPYKN